SRQRVRPRRACSSSRSACTLPTTRWRRPAGGVTAYASASASSARSSRTGSSTPIGGRSGMQLLPPRACTQLERPVADARLHGAERRVLACRDLAVRQPFEVGDLDGASLLLRQLGQGFAHVCRALAARGCLVGTFGVSSLLPRVGAARLGPI